MQKAVGRAGALIVAIAILAIAFRAGTQTSPYIPASPEPNGSSAQSSYQSSNANGGSSAARNSGGTALIPGRQARILSVSSAPYSQTTWTRLQSFKESVPVTKQTYTRIEDRGSKIERVDPQSLIVNPRSTSGPVGKNPNTKIEDGRSRIEKVDPQPLIVSPRSTSGPVGKNPNTKIEDGKSRIEKADPQSSIVNPRIGSGPAAKIVSLKPTPSAAPQKPAIDVPKKSQPPQVIKPGFQHPDAVSPYHTAPVPITSAKLSAMPKSLPEAVVSPVIENPASKRRDLMPSPRPAEPSPTVAGTLRVPGQGTGSVPATDLPPPKEILPALDDTKLEPVGPISRLPDVLPESPSTSLVQTSYKPQPQESTEAPSSPPAVTQLPAPVPDPGSQSAASALVQAKCESAAKDLPSPAPKPEAVLPTVPVPLSNSPALNSEEPVKIINHEPEDLSPTLSPPFVVTLEAPPLPTVLTGQPSQLRVPRKQERPVRRIILMPQAVDEPPSGPVPPITGNTPSAPERIEAKTPSLPRNLRIPRKLPSGITDSALVLGPANELLESAQAAAQPEDVATPGGPIPAGEMILPAATPKAGPVQARTQPYLEKWLKDYIQSACGDQAEGLGITLDPNNRLQVHFSVKNDADGEKIGRKIMALPELAPYKVSLDVIVSP